eukprot:Em0017g640a
MGIVLINVGPLVIDTTDVGPLVVDPLDVVPLGVGSFDVGPLDVGPLDVGPLDVGPLDVGPLDVGPLGVGPLDVGSPVGPLGLDAMLGIGTAVSVSGFPRIATAMALVLTRLTDVTGVIRFFRIRSVIWPDFCFTFSTRNPTINAEELVGDDTIAVCDQNESIILHRQEKKQVVMLAADGSILNAVNMTD